MLILLLKCGCWPRQSVSQPSKHQATLVKESVISGKAKRFERQPRGKFGHAQRLFPLLTPSPAPIPLQALTGWTDQLTGGQTYPHMQKHERILNQLQFNQCI